MNTVRSYRCGQDVISLFIDVGNFSQASAGATNPSVNFSSALEFTLETTADFKRAVTVYSGPGCSGVSSLVASTSDDPLVVKTWNLSVYESENIASVYIQAGIDAQLELLPYGANYESLITLPPSATGGEADGETQTCFDLSDDTAGRIEALRLSSR